MYAPVKPFNFRTIKVEIVAKFQKTVSKKIKGYENKNFNACGVDEFIGCFNGSKA